VITCPNCQHNEISGSLFCSRCGAQLPQIEEPVSTNAIQTATIKNTFDGSSIPPCPPPPADAADCVLALHIVDSGDIIHASGGKDFTLGRSTTGQSIIPDIDLTPYQAYEAGVSRLHATISIKGSQVTIMDLESANGTRINGNPIEPHAEHSLMHGDILTLGKIKIQILIRQHTLPQVRGGPNSTSFRRI